jgi:hypothetical protein
MEKRDLHPDFHVNEIRMSLSYKTPDVILCKLKKKKSSK